MQNKPNLCVFWAVSGDCEEKQTQFKANLPLPSPVTCSTVLLSQAKGLPHPCVTSEKPGLSLVKSH